MKASRAQRELQRKWDRLGRDDIRRLQGEVLHRFIRDEVLPFSAHYRALFQAHGLRAEHIRTLDDLPKLPMTSKIDLLPTPAGVERAREFVLIPDEAALARRPAVILGAALRGRAAIRRELARTYRPIFLTSTTGRSTASVSFLYAHHDMDRMASAGERMIQVIGANPDDRLINAFPYAPHLAFWMTHYATQAYGLFSVDTGGGKVMGTEGTLRIMEKVKPRALIGVPTFIYHLLSEARDLGKQFPSLAILALGGEKLADGLRRKLRDLVHELGGNAETVVIATYGLTEAKMAWSECPFFEPSASGGYHLYPDLGLFEIVDPATGAPVPDGGPGELVFTPLDSRGSVVLRYRTGDVIDGGLHYGPCPRCGRLMPRLVGSISRQSERRELQLDKLKGTLVDFNELEHVLDDAEHVGTWQLEIRKIHDDPMELDELILHVENRSRRAHAQIERELSDLIAARTELRPNAICFHSMREMRKRQGVGVEMKEKRVVDNRPKAGKPAPAREGALSGGSPCNGNRQKAEGA